MNGKRKRALTLAGLAAIGSWSVTAISLSAQPGQQGQPGQSEQPSAVCMTGQTAKGGQLPIILPASNAAAMEAEGFEEVPCETAFGSPQAIERWRDYVCQIASVPAEATQEQFAANWGERPAVLCGMAELVSSPWNKRGEP